MSSSSVPSYTDKLGSTENLGTAGLAAGSALILGVITIPGWLLDIPTGKWGFRGYLMMNKEWKKNFDASHPDSKWGVRDWMGTLTHIAILAILVFILVLFIAPFVRNTL